MYNSSSNENFLLKLTSNFKYFSAIFFNVVSMIYNAEAFLHIYLAFDVVTRKFQYINRSSSENFLLKLTSNFKYFSAIILKIISLIYNAEAFLHKYLAFDVIATNFNVL